MFTVYLATCLENNKVYVGQTHTFLSKRRWAHINRKDYDDFFQLCESMVPTIFAGKF